MLDNGMIHIWTEWIKTTLLSTQFKTWIGYFCNFPFHTVGLRLTSGKWNHGKQNSGKADACGSASGKGRVSTLNEAIKPRQMLEHPSEDSEQEIEAGRLGKRTGIRYAPEIATNCLFFIDPWAWTQGILKPGMGHAGVEGDPGKSL